MDNLLNNIKTDKKIFKQVIEKKLVQDRKPSLITFIMPSTNFFDILRLIKLSEMNRAGFYIVLIIEKPEDQKEVKFFMSIIDKFIPNNKKIFLYEDIIKSLLSNKEYENLIYSYKINNLEKFNKYNELGNLSLSDLNRFLTQYFILKNSNLLIGQEADFFLTTSYKDLFFKSIPNLDEAKLPIKMALENIPFNWNFKDSIKLLERKLNNDKISSKQLFSIKKSLVPIEYLIHNKIKNEDFISVISIIKKFIDGPNVKQECFATKSNFKKIISILNNETRRRIISIIAEKRNIKAEEIRKIINFTSEKKHSLTNIVKHLKLLIEMNLIYKKERIYELKTKRIILDIPISWFSSIES